jgi:hypothetical protein
MGPVSQVACCQQKLDFSPLLNWLLWERNYVWTCGSVSRRVVDWDRSPFFSGIVDPFNFVDDYAKGCYTRTV